ncbi:TPA: hypothetical protein ACH3X1_008618 [Trebouxia sp. C0004]
MGALHASRSSVTKQRLPVLLRKWYAWGQRQPDLFRIARQLCSGPLKSGQVFDRATIQGIRFSTTKSEGKKKARESVVLMSDDDKFWAGRVRFFLTHTPPGFRASSDTEVYIAHVHRYNHLPEREAMSVALGCPVFKASYMDDSRGNMWPVEKLAPCQLAAVNHKTRKDCVVILGRFANFLETVPT